MIKNYFSKKLGIMPNDGQRRCASIYYDSDNEGWYKEMLLNGFSKCPLGLYVAILDEALARKDYKTIIGFTDHPIFVRFLNGKEINEDSGIFSPEAFTTVYYFSKEPEQIEQRINDPSFTLHINIMVENHPDNIPDIDCYIPITEISDIRSKEFYMKLTQVLLPVAEKEAGYKETLKTLIDSGFSKGDICDCLGFPQWQYDEVVYEKQQNTKMEENYREEI